jgi:hypothetical protein
MYSSIGAFYGAAGSGYTMFPFFLYRGSIQLKTLIIMRQKHAIVNTCALMEKKMA